MGPSIHHIVKLLNTTIDKLFPATQVFGIAKSAIRGEERWPYLDGAYIGIDDKNALQVYHKVNAMASTLKTLPAYGNSRGSQVNSYNMAMIVFNNQRRTNLKADELVLLIQSRFPSVLPSQYYQSIRLQFNSAILNDETVFAQEYTASFKLTEFQNLIQINYTLETTFKHGCFITCPEDILTN